MYVLVYQTIENNSISYQRARLYNNWRDAKEAMENEYDDIMFNMDGTINFHNIHSVSATIKCGSITYDWSVLMV